MVSLCKREVEKKIYLVTGVGIIFAGMVIGTAMWITKERTYPAQIGEGFLYR